MKKPGYFEAFDRYALLAVVAMLALGSVVVAGTLGEKATYDGKAWSLRYPAQWLRAWDGDRKAAVLENAFAKSTYRDQVRVERIAVAASTNKEAADGELSPVMQYLLALQKNLPMYRQLGSAKVNQGGREVLEVSFAFVHDPVSPTQLADLPVVVQGVLRLVPAKNGRAFYAVSYTCDKLLFRENTGTGRAVLDSFATKD